MKNWSFMQWIITVIIFAAAIAILMVVLPLLGFSIPAWAMTIFWILVVAVVAVVAIRFLVALWNNWGNP
jgi:hypothetical protein